MSEARFDLLASADTPGPASSRMNISRSIVYSSEDIVRDALHKVENRDTQFHLMSSIYSISLIS